MQAICKAVRKQAVCGSKPGGSGAYTLRESCIKNNPEPRKKQPNKSSKQDAVDALRLKTYVEFVEQDFARFKVREEQLRRMTPPAGQIVPPPGSDHSVVQKVILDSKDQQTQSVHARIKAACIKFNAKQGNTRRNIVFNHTVERLVIMGVTNHYTGVLKELSKFGTRGR
jgi:hypothetical protein